MKQGRFTLEEQQIIRLRLSSDPNIDLSQLANEMERDLISMKKFVQREGLVRIDKSGENKITIDENSMLKQLRSENFYKSIKKQLSDDELHSFNNTWVQTVSQFDMDIRMTEKLQLKQLILLDIFMDRVNIDKKNTSKRVDEISHSLTIELSKDRVDRDATVVRGLENELSFLRLSVKESAKEFREYLTEFKNIQKQLDGARSDRRKKIDDSKTNFAGWIRLLQDRIVRDNVGRQMAVFNMAKDKAKEKLYEYHEYDDHKVDTPILNEESVKDE